MIKLDFNEKVTFGQKDGDNLQNKTKKTLNGNFVIKNKFAINKN